MTKRVDPRDVRSWDGYVEAQGAPGILEPSQPGEPYAIIPPPHPMWLVQCSPAGELTPVPIVLLRARRMAMGSYQANGGWIGERWIEAWEYLADPSASWRSGGPLWQHVYGDEKTWLSDSGKWGAQLGIAEREFHPEHWEGRRQAYLSKELRRSVASEKARAKRVAKASA